MTFPIVYAADTSPLSDLELYRKVYTLASPRRREKTDRFRFSEDRQLSLGAEVLLRHALRKTGYDGDLTEIYYGPQNKPYLKGCSCFFNLSHSGKWAVCAIAPYELGCDVERIAPVDLKLASRFAREEYENICAQGAKEQQLELFYRYWTLKESFMKATGLGMNLPLDAFHIVCGERISVVQSVDRRAFSFREFSDLPGYKCALCCAGDCSNAELQIIDIKEILRKDLL